VALLKQRGANLKGDVMDAPVCRSVIVQGPGGNEIFIHNRKVD